MSLSVKTGSALAQARTARKRYIRSLEAARELVQGQLQFARSMERHARTTAEATDAPAAWDALEESQVTIDKLNSQLVTLDDMLAMVMT